jgi:uncharacterized protein
MRRKTFLVFFVVIILVDLYIFQAIKAVTQGLSPRWRTALFVAHWGITALAIAAVFILLLVRWHYPRASSYLITILLGLYIAKLIACAFLLVDDLRRLIQLIFQSLRSRPGASSQEGQGIPRSAFITWLGIGLGTAVYSSLIYGFTNKYNYKIHRMRLAFDNLPGPFKGLKIVQISDIHSGSLNNIEAVNRGVDLVLAQKPDIILFTGDLVNDRAVEMQDYQPVFSRLTAPMGVYSTLGNHDYGDYAEWDSQEEKSANLDRLKQIQREMGWRLLVNEHVILEKDGGQIALIGVENWSSKARFPKYGRMDLAYPGTEKYPFKILMSHDPSHWDAEVRPEYPDIDLTLSGHTHGMQYGLELPGFKWSPVQYVYKEWAGLYAQGKQRLYVNRGYGFIGYPGRFGILPEITVIELV